ncbi:MAG TPA: hypothetical protein VNN79_16505 [Actinomycetota bacterium]|nr:hypothetical protein [Actinomycetota bacterium]
MNGIRQSLRAVATTTLALMIVVGAASAALADGGPDRVPPAGSVITVRPGFGDHIQPPRPGFGDRIQPVPPAKQAPVRPVVIANGEAATGGTSELWIWLLVGVTVVAAAGAWSATMRRRGPRLAG